MGRLAIRLAVRRVYSVVSSPCAAAEPRGELGREVGRGEWTVRVAGPFRATRVWHCFILDTILDTDPTIGECSSLLMVLTLGHGTDASRRPVGHQ